MSSCQRWCLWAYSLYHWSCLRKWGWFLNVRHFAIWEWKSEHQSTALAIKTGRRPKAWKWFHSPSTKTIGLICQKPIFKLLNDEFAEFTEFTNLPNYFYTFIKTWAIRMGWVGMACKGSRESETMVSENSPAGSTEETAGGTTAQTAVYTG